MCDVRRRLLSGAPLPTYVPSMPKGKVLMWNEAYEGNGSFRVHLNSDGDGEIGLNLGLGGGGVQVQGGGKQPFQFSLGDKHQFLEVRDNGVEVYYSGRDHGTVEEYELGPTVRAQLPSRPQSQV